MIDRQANAACLSRFISRRHNDQDIHVAVLVRFAVGIGAEQNDALGMKFLCNLPSQLANLGKANASQAISGL